LITEEDFMQGDIKKYISYLKLRGSIGRAGSQNLGNYDWITRVGSDRYNESPAIIPASIGNPALQWERTEMVDIALDFGFFEERLRGTLGVYQKLSDKLIYSRPLPPSTSFS